MQDKDIMNDEELLLHEKAEQLTKELEKKWAAQDRLIATAIDFICPNCTQEAYNDISNFIKNSLPYDSKKCNVCILWYRDEEFMDLLKNHKINIGKKEVIITPSYVQGTENYSLHPRLISC